MRWPVRKYSHRVFACCRACTLSQRPNSAHSRGQAPPGRRAATAWARLFAPARLEHPQAKAWRAICACRTPALGGKCMACSDCGHSHRQHHSCRNRHCPTCGARAKDAWLQARIAQVLDVPYTHRVFALPHEFNALYRSQTCAVIEALFSSVKQSLSEFSAQALDGGIGRAGGIHAGAAHLLPGPGAAHSLARHHGLLGAGDNLFPT